jgi:DNA-binding Lrp family transcriptional regulator
VTTSDIDDIDHRLLGLLRQDGRRTYSEMAPVVGLSVAAVKRRVDRMRETGLITGFSVQIDHAQLGWGIEAFAELRYTGRTRVSDIVASTAKIPEVQAVYGTAGDPDALIHLRVRDVAHLRDVIDTLRATGTVTGTKTLMVLGSWTRDT